MTERVSTADTPEEPASSAAVRARGVVKSFPGVNALLGVDFELRAGEVHGLVGENGAGKSSLIKIITGAYDPDEGEVELFGRVLAFGDPRANRDAGIAAIYQELNIVPQMSAWANVFLGNPPRRGVLLSKRAARVRFRALARRLGVEIDPNAAAGTLSVADRQMLEIMRALESNHRILIMDEPTASLGSQEREKLYEIVRGIKNEGVSVLYITHDLDEVLALCDRVSVMRDGSLVETKPVTEWTQETLVQAMLGRRLPAKPSPRQREQGDEAVRVEGLAVPPILEDVALTLHRGEILGVAGLVGSGRTELLRALAGTEPGARGRLFVDGREVSWPHTVRRALALGIALAPEDRKIQGLVLGQPASVNVTLTDMGAVAAASVVLRRRRLDRAREAVEPLAFDPRRLEEPAGTFSGGNQQKLVVAKWLHRGPKILLLDEPTRGIDVGAKAEMFSVMRRLADQGMSIVMVSSEIEEVVAAADRVLVLAGGRSIATLDRGEASVERILNLVFRIEAAA